MCNAYIARRQNLLSHYEWGMRNIVFYFFIFLFRLILFVNFHFIWFIFVLKSIFNWIVLPHAVVAEKSWLVNIFLFVVYHIHQINNSCFTFLIKCISLDLSSKWLFISTLNITHSEYCFQHSFAFGFIVFLLTLFVFFLFVWVSFVESVIISRTAKMNDMHLHILSIVQLEKFQRTQQTQEKRDTYTR